LTFSGCCSSLIHLLRLQRESYTLYEKNVEL